MLPVLGTSDVTAVEFKFVPERAKLLSLNKYITNIQYILIQQYKH